MLNNFKEFFSFTKKELNGLLVFSILLILVALAPLVYRQLNPPQKYDHSSFKSEIDAFYASATEKQRFKKYEGYADEATPHTFTGSLFKFNPNNLSIANWKKLGLNDRQIKVIKNYESKGGKFYKKEDLKKIYSIKPADYARLQEFIDIPPREETRFSKYNNAYKKPEDHPTISINLNTADSVQLETLNGIGPAFATRIIKYRNRLGGFYSKEQLKEVYGLDSLLYQKIQHQIIIDASFIQQIPVNTATFDNFKKHPYLSYKQINAIIQYRKQHGNFKNIDAMKAIVLLNETLLNKIAPYLSFK